MGGRKMKILLKKDFDVEVGLKEDIEYGCSLSFG